MAVSRNFLAFEDEFAADGEKTRCWVTLLPLSSAGAWVDYVYAFVSFGPADAAKAAAASGQDEPEAAEVTEAVQDQTETPEVEPEVTEVTDMVVEEVVEAEPEALEVEAQPDAVVQAEPEMLETAAVEPETPEIVAEPEDIADAPEDVLELDSPVEEPEAAAEQAGELPVAEAEPVPTSKKGAAILVRCVGRRVLRHQGGQRETDFAGRCSRQSKSSRAGQRRAGARVVARRAENGRAGHGTGCPGKRGKFQARGRGKAAQSNFSNGGILAEQTDRCTGQGR